MSLGMVPLERIDVVLVEPLLILIIELVKKSNAGPSLFCGFLFLHVRYSHTLLHTLVS